MSAEPHTDGPPSPAGQQPSSTRRDGAGYDRTPPHNLDAEVSVIGAMLLSRDAIADVCEILVPEDFYRGAHRTMFEAARDLNDRGEPVDPVTLADELSRRGQLDDVGGAVAIARVLDEVPTAANATYYARIVVDQATRRRLIDTGTAITRLGYDAQTAVDEAVDTAESEVYRLGARGQRVEFTLMKDLLTESFERLERLSESDQSVTGLPTGFKDFDELTSGLQPANLFILAARPAMGKSTLVTNMATYVAVEQRRPVVMFSLEMSQIELITRILSAEARIDSKKLQTGRLADPDWGKLAQAMGRLSEAPLFIDDTAGITLMEIRAKCRRLKQQHGLDMVIIDYLQLMQPGRRSENRVQEVSEISRGLKILAKELDLPVLALSQLSRKPEDRTDRRPQLSDLRESGCLVPETRILRADTGAETTLGELHASGATDIPVWAVDDRGRMVQATMSHVFSSGVKPVFDLRLASGRVVRATGNHPFLTLDGWEALDRLEVGSRIAVPRRVHEPVRVRPWATEQIIMLAHLIGDGCMAPRQPLHYTSADPRNLEAVAQAAAHFGVAPRLVAQKTWWHLYLPAPRKLTHGRRNPIVAWLDTLGLAGTRSGDKFVPPAVFGLPDDQVALFLHHLWATDGHVGLQRSGTVSVYYGTSSRRLADDLHGLLLRFGITSRLRSHVEARTGREAHQIWISGGRDVRIFLQRIGCHGARGDIVPRLLTHLEGRGVNPNVDTIPPAVWDRVRAAMRAKAVTTRDLARHLEMSYAGSSLYRSGVSRDRLARVNARLDDAELDALAGNDLFWDRVVAIEPRGETEVFDATVPGPNCFIANGIVAHNSIEQDADIVAFIYRDEVYDPESTAKGEAELIVSKHRNGPLDTVRLAFLGSTSRFASMKRGPSGPPPGSGPL